MFLTKSYFKKWVKDNIGDRSAEIVWSSVFGKRNTMREEDESLREEIRDLQQKLFKLSSVLGFEYKKIEEKTGFYKIKKSK